jgi:two-component system, NtrC family, nitrogen regulation response regulator GlnG
MAHRVLLAEDDRTLRTVMGKALAGCGLEVVQTGDGGEAFERLRQERFDVAVVDIRMPTMTGLELLRRSAELTDPPHVVVITAQGTMSNAIEAMKGGAYDYLCKPFDLDVFEELVLRAAGDRATGPELVPELADGPESDAGTRVLYGRSPAMQRVFKAIGRAAQSRFSVLICGESGTGKELVARILHASSERATGPFVAVNAAAIPAELLEADLFGHSKGAFTGATSARPGKFVAADGGTLLLDEIGEMPLALQAKLLRVLESKEFHPVGAHRQVRVDVRILAASNRDLLAEVKAGRFRGDLYYRLNVLTIGLPSLRERTEDVPLLAGWLLDKHAREGATRARRLDDEAMAWLQEQDWPGNVRELENALVRAATWAQGPVIRVADLVGPTGGVPDGAGATDGFEAGLRERLRSLVAEADDGLHERVVAATERVLLELVLERTGGNQLAAAKLMGINRNTLKRKMDEHGVAGRKGRS